ncbi:hypothetical protein H072_747 [Dactylellina haptotyla CBS 200.50]|uniref:Uncharacterized protein n=1 Tax=Dactylellina haptotyla (strain CBS 200.50) TaxID=1284197 RepID=S8AQM1_DACHA|nr:hypothetical protein H072_747 [Dactylellina haptotyla CBS 200.50]
MNSNSNDKSSSMSGFQDGMRSNVDREDNPMQMQGRRMSWTDKLKETMGFGSSSQSSDKPIMQQAQMKAESAMDNMKQSMESTDTGAKMQRRGSDVLEEVKREMKMKEIGGNQLFGSPKGTKREGMAGNGFLTKYANESAPGENSA